MPESLVDSGPEVTDSIELQPFYYDAKHIIQPKQVVIATRYFWERWAPLLGPTLTVLVVRLRMHCYYNKETQERRDWCFPTQQTLAAEVGISRWTVMRELKKPLASQFVRIQYRSRYDRVRQQTVRISSLYHVAMDDPLVADDQSKLTVLATSQDRAPIRGRETVKPEVTDLPVVTPAIHSGHLAKRLPAPDATEHIAMGPSRGKLPPKEEPEPITLNVDVDDIAQELMDEQLSPRVARKLASAYPSALIREKLAKVRLLAAERGALRNAPGFLLRAIEDDYQLSATGTDGRSNAASLLSVRPERIDRPAQREVADCRISADTSQTAHRTDVWEMAKGTLRVEMTPAAYSQWLQSSNLLNYTPGRVQIAAPDAHVQRYIQRRLARAAEAALREICGEPVLFEVLVDPMAAARQ